MAVEKLYGIDTTSWSFVIAGFSCSVVEIIRRPWTTAVHHMMYHSSDHKGLLDVMKRMSTEKGVGSLFANILPEIRHTVPRIAPEFIVNSYLNRIFYQKAPEQSKLQQYTGYFCVGALAHMSNAYLWYPINAVLKVQYDYKLSFGQALGKLKLNPLVQRMRYKLPQLVVYGGIYFGLHESLLNEVVQDVEGNVPTTCSMAGIYAMIGYVLVMLLYKDDSVQCVVLSYRYHTLYIRT